jgi:hypothetical protein
MSPRTIFLGKLFGFYFILLSLSMVARKQVTINSVTAALNNAPLMFCLGIIGLVAALAMILSHNIWSGGPLPVIVTLIGWATLIKCLLILFLSPETESNLVLSRLNYEKWFYVYAPFSFLLGAYLLYAASTSKDRQTS